MDARQQKIYEYECECGHIWLDTINYGCPMCENRDDIARRDYKIKQPTEYCKVKDYA